MVVPQIYFLARTYLTHSSRIKILDNSTLFWKYWPVYQTKIEVDRSYNVQIKKYFSDRTEIRNIEQSHIKCIPSTDLVFYPQSESKNS